LSLAPCLLPLLLLDNLIFFFLWVYTAFLLANSNPNPSEQRRKDNKIASISQVTVETVPDLMASRNLIANDVIAHLPLEVTHTDSLPVMTTSSIDFPIRIFLSTGGRRDRTE
jgi:hypothetical protein